MRHMLKWFVFLPVVWLAGCATPPELEGGSKTEFSIDELKQRAEMAGYAGSHTEALMQYQQILDKEPDNIEALVGAGESLLAAEQPKRAEIYLERALNLQPKHSNAREARALAWLMQGNYAAAQRSFLELISDGVEDWRIWNGLGVIDDLFGEYESATMRYQRAIAIEPKRVMLHNNLGYSRMMAHDYVAAEESLRHALLLDPGNTRVINNLGMCIAWQGRYDEAINLLSKVMDAAAANNNVGYVAYLRTEYAEAKEMFSKAMRLRPSFYVKAATNLDMVNRKLESE